MHFEWDAPNHRERGPLRGLKVRPRSDKGQTLGVRYYSDTSQTVSGTTCRDAACIWWCVRVYAIIYVKRSTHLVEVIAVRPVGQGPK